VNLQPGRAIDRLGRVIIVSEQRPLVTADFQLSSSNVNDLFPVYVQAIETPQTGSTQPGKCATAQPNRIEEAVQISFGTPGSELAVLEQDAATVDRGFGTPGLNDKVLVGWVGWSGKQFTRVSTTSSDGRGIRYVGVVASEVVSGGGTLGLRTRPTGSRFAVTVTENSTGGCELRFGKQDGNGAVSPTFTVDEKGNVTYTGALNPPPMAKTVAESGVAFDGVRLPLPTGITDAQISSGAVRLHVMLTPDPQVPAKQNIAGALRECIPFVLRCSVDMTSDRRVHCIVRWCEKADPLNTFIDLPAGCTYVIIASGK